MKLRNPRCRAVLSIAWVCATAPPRLAFIWRKSPDICTLGCPEGILTQTQAELMIKQGPAMRNIWGRPTCNETSLCSEARWIAIRQEDVLLTCQHRPVLSTHTFHSQGRGPGSSRAWECWFLPCDRQLHFYGHDLQCATEARKWKSPSFSIYTFALIKNLAYSDKPVFYAIFVNST